MTHTQAAVCMSQLIHHEANRPWGCSPRAVIAFGCPQQLVLALGAATYSRSQDGIGSMDRSSTGF